jgi:EmrB/QacA subfamily drug resistance transporter
MPTQAPRLRIVFAGLLLTVFLAALDSTIVATALPTIVGELGGLEHISWVVTAYLLAQTAVTPLYGKLGDLYGRKRVLQAAMVIFLAGSALCGAAQGMTELIAFRALQGLGGGGLIVSAQAVIGDLVPPRRRGRYSGIFGAVFGLASVVGPLVGGFLTTHVDWRWIFYVNLPVGVAALLVLQATLPGHAARMQRRIDYLGAALIALTLSAIVLGTSLGGNTYDWGSPFIVGMGIAAIASLAAFVLVERRATEPVLPLSLFRNRVFRVTAGIGAIVGFAMYGSITYIPLFLQVVNDASPTRSGLELLPMMVGLVTTSVLSGRLIARSGRYKRFPIAGTAVVVLALWLLSTMDATTGTGRASLFMFILGLGLGGVMQVLTLAVQNAADYEQLGVATSGATMFRSIGGSVGTALLGAIFTNQLAGNLAEHIPPEAIASGAGRAMTEGRVSPTAIHHLPSALSNGYVHAFTDSLNTVFLTAAAIAVVAFVLAWLLQELPLRETVATTGLGSTFAIPRDASSLAEIEEALGRLGRRDVSRALIARMAERAEVDLSAGACVLLIRLANDPESRPSAAVTERFTAQAVERALGELESAGHIEPGRASRPLTPSGHDVHRRLVAVGRERFDAALAEWQPGAHPDLAALIDGLAREFLSDGEDDDWVVSRRRGAGTEAPTARR